MMIDTRRKPTARQNRAAEAEKSAPQRLGLSKLTLRIAKIGKSVPQCLGSLKSAPRAGTTATLATKPHHPELERNVLITTKCHPEPSHKCYNDKQSRDGVVDESCKRPRQGNDRRVADKKDSNRQRQTYAPQIDHAAAPPNSSKLIGGTGLAVLRLSKIVCPGIEFPPPGKMSQKDTYANMALHCMTFLSSLNELAIDYEVASHSQVHQLENAHKTCGELKKLKKDAEDQAAKLHDTVKGDEDSRRKMDASKSERKRLKEEVSILNVRLNVAAKLRDDAVIRAVDEAKRELNVEHEARIDRAVEKLRVINGKPRIDIIHLAQVLSNVEFVELLENDKAPVLTDELVDLKKQKAGLSHADDVFEEHVRELEEILKGS